MPVANINVLQGHSRAQLRQVIAGVSGVLVDLLKSMPERLEVWVTEIDPELWGISGVPASDVLQHTPLAEVEMPFVRLVLMRGRPPELRHAVIAAITKVVAEALEMKPNRIRVQISECETDNWGIGGVPASILRAAEQAKSAEKAA